MEDDILETLFEKREDTGAFNFECIEYHQLLNKRKNKKTQMNNYISERVHPKSQNKLKKLIDDFICSVEDYEYFESKHYYYAGFKDAFNLFVQLTESKQDI